MDRPQRSRRAQGRGVLARPSGTNGGDARLEIRGEPLQVLLVGEYADRLDTEKVVVPDRQEAHQHGKVALERCATKVLVELVKTVEHGAEIFRADRDHRRQT